MRRRHNTALHANVMPLGCDVGVGNGSAVDWCIFAALRAHAAPHVRIVDVDAHINDAAFAEAVSAQLCELLKEAGTAPVTAES